FGSSLSLFQPRHGVNGLPAGESSTEPNLEVQVRATGAGGKHLAVVALVGDVLASGDLIAGFNLHPVGKHVPVDGRALLAVQLVVDDNPLAKAASLSSLGDHAVGIGVNRCPLTFSKIHTLVVWAIRGAKATGEGVQRVRER